jgi:hypothetical protein
MGNSNKKGGIPSYELRKLLPAHTTSADVFWPRPILALPSAVKGLTGKHVPVCPRAQADAGQAQLGRR